MAIIRGYWCLVAPNRRRTCLFRESCSAYVYRIAATQGAWRALGAARERLRRCAPGFSLAVLPEGLGLICRDGTIIHPAALNVNVIGWRVSTNTLPDAACTTSAPGSYFNVSERAVVGSLSARQ